LFDVVLVVVGYVVDECEDGDVGDE